MSVPVISIPTDKLVQQGLSITNALNYQLSPDELIQDSLRLGEGILNDTGALMVKTGEFTGRSPKDKFIVRDAITADTVDWNEFNQPLEEKYYHLIHKKIIAYLDQRPEIWIRDAYACADERYRINIRVVNEKPWENLFAHNMFLRPMDEDLEDFKPDWHIITAPGLRLDPMIHGTRQHNATVVSFKYKTILIAGSGYTGEIKKSIFGVLNFILPQAGVLSMHCSANVGKDGDTAIFFGLSGTGKTTLSADPGRKLIGDDEHGWTADNVFNFEGGCYAKTIDLNEEKEPEIYHAIREGALVENVGFFRGSNKINFSDRSITENTRVSYPIDFISNAIVPSVGEIPKNIFFLTCDAYGILPPISKLTPGQAMYQFISGYTAKVAGTETGITEPKSTFSACFGAPFLPLHPAKYAQMLGDKIKEHKVNIWMVNTGWTGGGYGKGSRIKLAYTRAMITAALEGKLDRVAFEQDSIFGVLFPTSCEGVPSEILNPAWKDKEAYNVEAKKLAALFIKNFQRFAGSVNKEIIDAAPTV